MTSNRGLPSPARRLIRDRALLATSLFAAVLAIASASIESRGQLRLTSEVNAHWRGLYDILVRPAEAALDIEATRGLVEPNFLGFTGKGGITRVQLEQIRTLPQVEVAAPVAFVGLVSTAASAPSLHISSIPKEPTLFRATLTTTTTDGLRPHLVMRSMLRVLLGPGNDPQAPMVATDVAGQPVTTTVAPDGASAIDVGTTGFLPPLSSPILAIDPEAERALLGASGAFLDPLTEVSTKGPFTAKTFDLSWILPRFDARLEIRRLQDGTQAMLERPIFPILVSQRVYSPLNLTLAVVRLGSPIANVPTGVDGSQLIDQVASIVGTGTTEVGTTSIDLGPDLRPLRVNDLSIPWPGSDQQAGPTEIQTATSFDARITSRPTYLGLPPRTGSAAPRFRIEPRGIVGPGGGTVASSSGVATDDIGREQSYRTLTSEAVPAALDFSPTDTGDTPFVLAPVGEFDLGTLNLPTDPLNYAPLGAYDPPDTTLVLDGSRRAIEPTSMTPTLNPAGLLDVPPLAITDLAAAEGLRGPAPIDAIRIRVAGLSDFGPDSIATVETVASQIAAMGLRVDIVAGSSPQVVDVFVPAYDTTTDPPSDLGDIQQHWTTIGAATRIVSGIGATDEALLALSMLTIVTVVFGVQAVDASARREEAAILEAFGWPRHRIMTWFVGTASVAGAVVLGAGVTAWMLLGHDPIGLLVATTALLFPVAAALSAYLLTSGSDGATRRPTSGRRWRLSAANIPTYATNAVMHRPWRSLTMVAGMAVASTAIAVAIAVVVVVGPRVGPTLLAGAVTARLQLFQAALLALVGGGGVAFVWLALRRDLADRSAEIEVLGASGWTPGTIQRMLRWYRLALFLPAAFVAIWIAAVAGPPATDGIVPAAAIATLAAVISLSGVLWGAAVRPVRR